MSAVFLLYPQRQPCIIGPFSICHISKDGACCLLGNTRQQRYVCFTCQLPDARGAIDEKSIG